MDDDTCDGGRSEDSQSVSAGFVPASVRACVRRRRAKASALCRYSLVASACKAITSKRVRARESVSKPPARLK